MADARPAGRQGSKFRVTLHCAGPGEGPTTRDLRRSTAQRPRLRILVVDDEPLIGTAMRRLLRGDDVHVVHDGPSALAHLETDSEFDFVICDVMMPGMTGLELADAITARHPWLARRIGFMTGGVFVAEIRRRLAASKSPCFDKPLDLEALNDWFQSRDSSR